MFEHLLRSAQLATGSRREFLQLLGAAGAVASTGGLIGGCEQALLDPTLAFPSVSTPPVLDGDPSSPWWTRGNYAPVMNEMEAFDLEVIGSIPPEIEGFFLRNGPNPASGTSNFWLFGDGMLHGVELSCGRAVSYRNRWVQTAALGADNWSLLSNLGNTSLVHHAGTLLALYEIGAPHKVNLPDLSTDGVYHFDFDLAGPMTAHPKLDPVTGELFFIGSSPMPPHLRFHTVNASGALVRTEEIQIPRAVLMHDFQLTERYAVFFDLPLIVDLEQVEETDFPVVYAPEHGARIGVMPRDGGNEDIQWFDVDPCYVFHTMNAYEDQWGRVVVDGCRFSSIWENGFNALDPLPYSTPWQWTLDLSTGMVSEGALMDNPLDFPMIDLRRQGREHRVNYGLQLVPATQDYPMHPDGILKHDRLTGALDVWDCGYGVQPDEALFVPDPSDTGEDAGWLLSMVYNRAEGVSELVILDAMAVSAGPIARVKMPQRVPFGFHGLWVPTDPASC